MQMKGQAGGMKSGMCKVFHSYS